MADLLVLKKCGKIQNVISSSDFETRLRILRIFLIPIVAGSRIVSLIKFYSANISRILESLVDSPILEGFEDGKKNVLLTRYRMNGY